VSELTMNSAVGIPPGVDGTASSAIFGFRKSNDVAKDGATEALSALQMSSDVQQSKRQRALR
jgi:hypothetical protein